MKIKEVQACYPRWEQIPQISGWQSHLWQIVVRVTADDGTVGYGYGGGGNAGVAVVNSHLRELSLGRQINGPDDILHAYKDAVQAIIPYGRGGLAQMALSGLDLALWDLLGKAEKCPVYRLLKGNATPTHAYATTNDLELSSLYGYEAVKITYKWSDASDEDLAEDKAAKARSALGPNKKLMFDCYMSWSSRVALRMAERLKPYTIWWFEDVLTPDDLDELAVLRPKINPILLAGGEHEMTLAGFRRAAAKSSLDIWQPDVTWCGGLSGTLGILEAAKKAEVPVILHRGGEPWGLHLIVAGGCAPWAETMPHRWQPGAEQLWLDEPVVEKGMIVPHDAPGFGVKLNESLL